MNKKLYIPLLSLGLFISTATFAQDDKTKKDGHSTEQDTTKKPAGGGTRMAINSQGLPSKGGTKANNSNTNKAASDPKKDETKPKKEDPK